MSVKYFQLFGLILCISSGLCAASRATKGFRNDYTYNARANGWFKVHPIPVNWQRARLICHYEGAELVSPLNSNIMAGVKEIIQATKPQFNTYFSGVHETLGGGVYTSIEGVPLEQLHIEWRQNEPHNLEGKENCLEFDSEGKFNDADCEVYLPYICFRKYSNTDLLTSCETVDTGYIMQKDLEVQYNKPVGSIYENFGISETRSLPLQHCYKLHKNAYTWELAHIICQAEGGYLAVINTEEEAHLLNKLLMFNAASFSETYAVGFSEWKNDGGWWTVQGQTLEEAGFTKWGEDLPTISWPKNQTSRRQSCGGFQRIELANIWCDEPYRFICEKPI